MEIKEAIKKAERLVSVLKEAEILVNQLSGINGISADELANAVIPVIQKSIDGNAQEVPKTNRFGCG